jgi:hypothetical protein
LPQSKEWPSPKLLTLTQLRLGWLHLDGKPRCTGEKDPHLGYQLFPNQGWVGIIQMVGQGFSFLLPSLFLCSSASNASISSRTKICVRIALSHARLIKRQKAMIIIPFTRSYQLYQLSRALIVQSSTDKQYSGDSYFREQDFIQTNLHGTDPNACLYYPSQPGGYSDLHPRLAHCACLLSRWGEGVAVPQGILMAVFSAGSVLWSTSNTQWLSGEGAGSQAVAASMSEPSDRL